MRPGAPKALVRVFFRTGGFFMRTKICWLLYALGSGRENYLTQRHQERHVPAIPLILPWFTVCAMVA